MATGSSSGKGITGGSSTDNPFCKKSGLTMALKTRDARPITFEDTLMGPWESPRRNFKSPFGSGSAAEMTVRAWGEARSGPPEGTASMLVFFLMHSLFVGSLRVLGAGRLQICNCKKSSESHVDIPWLKYGKSQRGE